MESNNDASIFSLPTELLVIIFNAIYCLEDVIRSGRTCKQWRKVIWESISDLRIESRISLKTLLNILLKMNPSSLREINVAIKKDDDVFDPEDLRVFAQLTMLNKINIESLRDLKMRHLAPYITHIQHLHLPYSVDDASFRSISSFLTNLRVLEIEGAKANYLQGLANLIHLEKLDVSNNPQTKEYALEEVFKLTNLTHFNVLNAGFLSSNFFQEISKLKKINCLCIPDNYYRDDGHNYLTALLTLPNLDNLTVTPLRDNSLAIVGQLTALTKLRGILSGSNFSGLDFLSNLSKLQELEIRGKHANETFFSTMVNLTKMVGVISGDRLGSLLCLTQIRELDLQVQQHLKSEFFENFAQFMSLESLTLKGTIEGLGVRWLTSLGHMTSLDIRAMRLYNLKSSARTELTIFVKEHLEEISALTQLKKLHLSNGEDFNRLAGMTNLEELSLSIPHSNVHENQVSALVTMPRLRKIYIKAMNPWRVKKMFAVNKQVQFHSTN